MMINVVNIDIGITMARGRIISMFITTIYKIIVLIAIILRLECGYLKFAGFIGGFACGFNTHLISLTEAIPHAKSHVFLKMMRNDAMYFLKMHVCNVTAWF